VRSGEEALAVARAESPDLVVLALMLPGVDGLTVCRRLKSDPATPSIPIIILTAKGDEADIVKGLNLGADDYVTKPFSPRVLLARAEAVLRRASVAPAKQAEGREEAPPVIEVRELVIDPQRHEVRVGGRPIELTSTEFRVLELLASRPGWVFTRHRIIDGVHGKDYPVTERAVDVQIVGLRKKLGVAGSYIEAVRGVGYRFKE